MQTSRAFYRFFALPTKATMQNRIKGWKMFCGLNEEFLQKFEILPIGSLKAKEFGIGIG